VLNKRQVAALAPYLLTGIYLWFCLHASGIHTTIAGVAVGLAIPLRDKNNSENSPLGRALHFLHPYVVFGVLPIFAFTSAGVNLAGVEVHEFFAPMPLGIALGLFLGKQVGIFGSIFLLVKTGRCPMPESMNWLSVYAVSILAGIGFTMSLFIALLAFSEPHLQDIAKIGIIAGSLLSSLWGGVVLFCSRPKT
jgi:NhaA family Na+:H+ antiporter